MKTTSKRALVSTLVVSAALLVPAAVAWADDEEPKAPEAPPASPWTVHRGDGWALAAPSDWRVWGGPGPLRPPMVAHLTGDGRAPLPRIDGLLAPLQVGLSVDLYPAGGPTPEEMVASIKDSAKGARDRKPRTPLPLVATEVELADGGKAWSMLIEMDKMPNRLAVYGRLISATPAGRTIVVSSWVVGGEASSQFFEASGINAFVDAHMRSLVFDPEKLDVEAVRKAYGLIPPKLHKAVAAVNVGNRSIESDPEKAIWMFERALEDGRHMLPAAKNGLAWVLLTSKLPELVDVPRALELAKEAATETGRRDAASLDTLALAHFESGEKAEAIAVMKEAIVLEPRNEDFKRTLERFEKDER